MNAYLVLIPEQRCDVYFGGYEPPEPWYPTGVFIAETPGQAKRDALYEWANAPRSGVYHDDWTNLRVRLLGRDVAGLSSIRRGELSQSDNPGLYDRAWFRVHEVLDHDGRPCDCPEDEVA
jgi:hypothetical protein